MPLMALVLVGMIGCSAKREWNHQQRQAMRQALRDYREMVYLNDLTDAEYLLFTDEVATDLETAYQELGWQPTVGLDEGLKRMIGDVEHALGQRNTAYISWMEINA